MAFDLTPLQKDIVKNRGGNLLVSAAAGSGKTTVLIERLMSYLLDPNENINIDDFLIITFTKAAATELRSKIATRLSDLIANTDNNQHLLRQLQRLYLAQISTVHSFCSTLLKRYAFQLDMNPDFRLLDEEDGKQLRLEVMEQVLNRAFATLGDDADIAAFIDNNDIKRNDGILLRTLLDLYNFSVSHIDPVAWLDSCIPSSYHSVTDLTDIPWGKFLFETILQQINENLPLMRQCKKLANEAGFDGAEKYMVSIIEQIEFILSSENWDQLYTRAAMDWGNLRFPKDGDPEAVEEVRFVRDTAKEKVVNILKNCTGSTEELLAQTDLLTGSIRGAIKLVHQFREEYDQEKKRRHLLDYNDLEHRTLDLLMGKRRQMPTDIADEIGAGFREVMVDEYQDANAVQDQIYYALTHKRNNCFMVGDVKQSIYRFRLADPTLFLEKYKDYRMYDLVSDGEPRKIILGNNFRSGCQIIEAVNSVFSICMSEQVGELTYGANESLSQLVPTPPLPEPAVELHCVETEGQRAVEECITIARRIRQLLDGKHTVKTKEGSLPMRGGDIAVLSHSIKALGPMLIRELDKYGIRCVSGKSNLLAEPEIQYLRTLLQAVRNPMLDIPLAGAMTGPVFGFTADELAAIRAGATDCTLYESVCNSEDPKAVAFLDVLNQLRRKMRTVPICELIDEIFRLTNMDAIYYAMPGGDARLRNLNEFYQIAIGYEQAGKQDLGRFIEYLQQRDEKGISVPSDSVDPDAVTVMTIHSSKGLEFPVVILADMAKMFNTSDLDKPVLCHKKLGIGMDAANHILRTKIPTALRTSIRQRNRQDGLSESIRLLYVAMTRAKERLIMYHCQKAVVQTLCRINQMDNAECAQKVISGTHCYGDWLLLSALRRAEANELFAVCGDNIHKTCSVYPWKITFSHFTAEEDGDSAESSAVMGEDVVSQLSNMLQFRYPYEKATQAPSKRTATQLKGRQIDVEAAEHTQIVDQHRGTRRGTEFGNAMHAAMQHLDFSACQTAAQVNDQIRRLNKQGVISDEYAAQIYTKMITNLFATEMGQKMASCKDIIREFKFSVLEDAGRFDPELAGEQILLQGVVDCAMIEDDGITVVDFKTDLVTEDSLAAAVDRYALQVKVYADALSRIYERPVKQAMLYFFRLNQFVSVL